MHTFRQLLLTLAVTAAALAGCAGDRARDGEDPTTRVDTVDGVVRVQHAGRAPVLNPAERLVLGRIGVAEEPAPDEFGRIVTVLADADGEIYVADAYARQVRVFGPDGTHRRTIGRRGGGPGEIETLVSMGWMGDSLLVMDAQNARLTLLTRAGEYQGQFPWARLSGPPVRFYEAGRGETFAWSPRIREVDGRRRTGSAWVRYTPDGPADTLEVPRGEGGSGGLMCEGQDMISFFGNPFAERLIWAPAPGGRVAVAYTGEYRIAFTSPDADTLRVLGRDAEPLPLTDADWAPVRDSLDAFRAARRGWTCEGGIARPATRPILRALYFAHDGGLLVEFNAPGGAALDRYDPAGRWIGTIPLPERDGAVPPFLRDDRLYLVTKDSLDVQQVRVYRLEPESGRR